jgi:UPF0755 protein
MKFKTLILVVFLAGLILSAFMGFSLFLQPGTNDKPQIVEVPRGASSNQIASLLQQKGVIKRKLDFKIAIGLLNMQNTLQAGRYKFSARPMLFNVLLKLRSGRIMGAEPLRVTFPEGTSIYKMGSILESNTVECFSDFRELVKDKLEGYLYPDTYIFDRNISAEALARLMVKRFKEVVIPYWNANQDKTKYTFEQILTLASIIEKEAGMEKERPIISSVFHNRMDINMALDSCSTVKYALERPTKIVYFDQLKYPSPYNTYLHRGLPPGPICNPGLNSIKAAIYPAKTDYLYFVANQDGSHTFSSSFGGHQKARERKK